MGQKTNPNGFRLVTTKKHLSEWYSDKLSYSNLVEEDYYIREKIDEHFNEFLSIADVKINRITGENNSKEYVNITIKALYPRAKEMYRKVTNYFNENTEVSNNKTLTLINNSKGNLKRFTSLLLKRTTRKLIRLLQLKTNKSFYIGFNFIKNPFENANLIARYIAEQLEKRTPFRRAVKETIKRVQNTDLEGIKVQVSGRLNGIEIARSEWKRNGRVPLHTLRAKIDYTHFIAHTMYGVIGIKVWLFAGEEN